MGKRAFMEEEELNEEMSLQITSMADIFTIILVFLLKSYSSGVADLSPNQGLTLPEARTSAAIKDTVKLEILKDAVIVDDRITMPLKDFAHDGKTESIRQALLRERQKAGADNKDSQLLFLADQRTPYSTLKSVMNSAASAGFVDLQLVVVQPD